MRIYLIAFLVSLGLQAQLVNDGALFSIDSETTLGVSANFLNVGSIVNNGEIYLNKNWQNMGLYSAPTGKLIFNSFDDQVIINNGQTIENLDVRNGRKIINDDLTVSETLDMTTVTLVVNEGVKFTLGQGVLITGAGSDAYIDGWLYRTGTGDLFYPIGNEQGYSPITMKEVSGLAPDVGIRLMETTPNNTLGSDLEELAIDTYWQMDKDENYTAGFIELPYASNLSQNDTANLVIAQAVDPESDFNTLGGTTDGNFIDGTVISEGNAVGQFYTIAYAPEDEPLPPLRVINVVTPLQDGKHDFLRIENIELYPDNQVEVFDRHGNQVFSIQNYNNRDRVFRGEPNRGLYEKLPDGNYFYTIKRGTFNVKSGFLFIKQ